MTVELPLKNKMTVVVDWNGTLEGNPELAALLAEFQNNGADVFIFSDSQDVYTVDSQKMLKKAGLKAKYLHETLKKDALAWKNLSEAVKAPAENIIVLDDVSVNINFASKAKIKGILWDQEENAKCVHELVEFAKTRGYTPLEL